MRVTATYHGEAVTIVSIIPDGQMILVSYIDASGNLKVDKDFMGPNANPLTIGTSAVSIA